MKTWQKKVLVVVCVFILWVMAGNDFFSPNKDKVEKRREEIRQEQAERERRAEEERKYRETPEYKAAKEAEQKAAEEKRLAEQQAAEEKKAQEEARKQAERQAEDERRASLLEYGVQLNYTIEKVAEHKYKVVGTTNLPDGMEIMVSLSNRYLFRTQVMGISDEEIDNITPSELAYLLDNTFAGDEKPKIKNGTFEVIYSNPKKLMPGEYELRISSPLNSLQPKNIQAILGERGSNLFGTGVIEEETFGGGKRIDLMNLVYLP
ncbi:MAG: hypothetical protein II857_02045 [Selenomonadaceae bacterium]|nr:hypothetical protein [Selenomonadaceae bacterium]